MKSVLVTGATGFVGSHLVEVLAEAGVGVRALVRRTSRTAALEALGVERVEGALEDPASMARAAAGTDVVFHLAALTRARNRDEFFRANAEGARSAARAAAEAGARLVFLSSLAAAGPSPDGRRVVESDPPRPITQYGRSKLAGEEACNSVGGALEVVVLRAPAVYGPRDRDLFRFFSMAARGVIAMPAGPERWLQLIHVRDLARALVCAGQASRPGRLYHVADTRAYGWTEVAALVAEAVGGRVRVVRVPAALVSAAAGASELGARLLGRATIFNRDKARELLAPSWLCETGAAERDLGFVARTSLARGLKETAEWYRSRGWL